ncbi:hypothetical protein CLOM_g15984, partial [Closterium sp. NIES-68]
LALRLLVGAATAALDLITPRSDPVSTPTQESTTNTVATNTVTTNTVTTNTVTTNTVTANTVTANTVATDTATAATAASAASSAAAGSVSLQRSEALSSAEEECGVLPELVEAVRGDYEQRAYFVTGAISTRFYDEACDFADPTVRFSGLALWRRNISLLTPFFDGPTIHLLDLQVVGPTPSSAARLETRWRLCAPIRLPWRPLVDINGSTVHTLNGAATKVVSHVEAWEVSAFDAIKQLFRPGPNRALK